MPVTNMESSRHEITPGVAWVMDGTVSSYLEGNLAITITDAGTGKPVWSAWTTERIKEPDSPAKRAQVDKKVARIVKKLPDLVEMTALGWEDVALADEDPGEALSSAASSRSPARDV